MGSSAERHDDAIVAFEPESEEDDAGHLVYRPDAVLWHGPSDD